VTDGAADDPLAELGGKTPLEAARTPNMDALAAGGMLGLSVPIAPGVTPGSGPAHLSLFGYDPLEFTLGRGPLEAMGIGFDLSDKDVAARGNFCTVDAHGYVTDRRAGRIKDEEGQRLCGILSQIRLPGVELFVRPVKEHRWALILRGEGLSGDLSETDPGVLGRPPALVEAHSPAGTRLQAAVPPRPDGVPGAGSPLPAAQHTAGRRAGREEDQLVAAAVYRHRVRADEADQPEQHDQRVERLRPRRVSGRRGPQEPEPDAEEGPHQHEVGKERQVDDVGPEPADERQFQEQHQGASERKSPAQRHLELLSAGDRP